MIPENVAGTVAELKIIKYIYSSNVTKTTVITSIKNENLTANISHLGAELISLQSNLKREYIWEGNPAFWGKHSPILFPIVGTLKNNIFHHKGINYNLSRHGFAREMEFALLKSTKNSATFMIQSNRETLLLYPFEFELHLIYTLEGNKLILEYQVINTGKYEMPFSIGAHPAFALPNNFENYAIAFDKEESFEYSLLENDLVSNNTKKLEVENNKFQLSYDLFENDALIFKTIQSKTITLLENDQPFLKVYFEGFPSLGLWTKMNAPFICIEPWYGYSDLSESSSTLIEKEGIQIIAQQATFKSEFSIEIL